MGIDVGDVAVARDATIVGGAVPWLMARRALTTQIVVRGHQFTGLVAFVPSQN
jgi:hypothetical protein